MYIKDTSSAGSQVKGLSEIYLNTFGYITDGFFVEVGAFNCLNWSNTHRLALAGWSGLLIEPQEQYTDDCRKLYADNPNVTVAQCCVGRYNGKTKLYLGGSLSTTKPNMINVYNDISWSQSSGLSHDNYVEVDIFTLDKLLIDYQAPVRFQVLSIDVEGAEMDVLESFDIDKWQPELVIVEAHEQYPDERLSIKSEAINNYFDFASYSKVYSDHINNIYRR
jgi:FkbM family methyltransferase